MILNLQLFGGRGSGGSRGRSGGGGKVSSDIQKKIDELKPLDVKSGQFQNPLPYIGDEASGRINRLYGDLDIDEKPKVMTVDPAKVYTTQEFVYKGTLEKSYNENYTSTKPIQAVRYDGKIVVVDGNHRALMSKWKKQKVKMEVYDL